MRQAAVDIASVFRWTPDEIGALYINQETGIYSLYFWQDQAKKKVEAINKSMGG